MIVIKGRVEKVYNLGGHADKTNLEIVKTILKEMVKSENLITFVTDRKGHDLRYAIDFLRLKENLVVVELIRLMKELGRQ